MGISVASNIRQRQNDEVCKEKHSTEGEKEHRDKKKNIIAIMMMVRQEFIDSQCQMHKLLLITPTDTVCEFQSGSVVPNQDYAVTENNTNT